MVSAVGGLSAGIRTGGSPNGASISTGVPIGMAVPAGLSGEEHPKNVVIRIGKSELVERAITADPHNAQEE